MDFSFSPEEERFRQDLRDWLQQNLPSGWGSTFKMPKGKERIEFLRHWQRKLHQGGYLGLSWPKEYGGRGASMIELAIFNEEMAKVEAPGPLNVLGLSMAGPTIIVHGTEEQKKRHLPKILNCDEIWCQGFSEPGSGSDVASIRTRAELRGDEFVVNGQKVWTSLAQIADWCMLLVRTDPDAPKHRGISYILVDMKSPGLTVRPLRQMTGESEFNEVFFEEVRVPRANLVGELNNGWGVALTTLMNERGTASFGTQARFKITYDNLVGLAQKSIRQWSCGDARPADSSTTCAAFDRCRDSQVELFPQFHSTPPWRNTRAGRVNSQAVVERAEPAHAGNGHDSPRPLWSAPARVPVGGGRWTLAT